LSAQNCFYSRIIIHDNNHSHHKISGNGFDDSVDKLMSAVNTVGFSHGSLLGCGCLSLSFLVVFNEIFLKQQQPHKNRGQNSEPSYIVDD